MAATLIDGAIVAVVSSLITFFVTTLSQRRTLEKMIKDNCANCLTKAEGVKNGAELKSVSDDVRAVRTAVIFLVTQAGGDLRELGLT
jgi:uncharacterized membrane protein YccC